MYENPFRIPNIPPYTGMERGRDLKNNPSSADIRYLNFYMTKFINYAISRVKYTELPEEIPPWKIETYLLYMPAVLFFKDSDAGLFACTPVSLQGNLDLYSIPVDRVAYSPNGELLKEFSKSDSVVMWNRPLCVPEILQIQTHSEILAEMRMSRIVNIQQLTTPVIITGDKETKLDMNNFISKMLNKIPYIKMNKRGRSNLGIEAIDMKIQPHYKDLLNAELREVADCLAGLGIEATGIEKAERMTASETNYNNGEIEMARNSIMDMRERAMFQFNKLFKTNVKVEWNSELPTEINRPEYFDPDYQEKETESNESEGVTE